MEFFIPIIKVIHVIVSIFLVLVILLQPGKSGDLGSVFGGGTSESVFGSAGAVPFLTKVTRLLAVVFLLSSLSLGYFSVQSIDQSVIEESPPVQRDGGADTQGTPDNTSITTETPEKNSPSVEDLEIDGMMQDSNGEGMLQDKDEGGMMQNQPSGNN